MIRVCKLVTVLRESVFPSCRLLLLSAVQSTMELLH